MLNEKTFRRQGEKSNKSYYMDKLYILFLPMGIYLPFLTKKMNSLKLYSIFMISLLFSVEIIQLITRRGIFDIDDIILNMLGAFIGFMIWKTKLVQKLLNEKLGG